MAREMSPVFMIQAKGLFDAGKFSAAVMTLQEGLKQYPHFISARVLLGEIYWTSGEVALARAELEQVIHAVPDNFAAHRKLAMIYRDAGEVASAIRSCRSVLQANPRDVEMRALLDQLHEMPGHGAEATVAEPDAPPPSPPDMVPSAVILETPPMARAEDAELGAEKVTESDSIDSETLAELYIIQGHREKGLLIYQRLAARYPGNARYRARVKALEAPSGPDDARSVEPLSSPSALIEENPARNRRQTQVRRLEGWLQVIRTRRRI
jgi:tetratricopeptide (TPR) repeat protein